MATTSKLDKTELKRLMREEKAKKIDSPLAKYNALNQLTCVLCSQVIKSELYWTAHVNSKGHLQQIEALKKSKQQEKPQQKIQQQTIETNTAFKRPAAKSSSRIENSEIKKAKLDNLIKTKSERNDDDIDTDEDDEEMIVTATPIKKQLSIVVEQEQQQQKQQHQPQTSATATTAADATSGLPAGFFDDPLKDAKMRNVNLNQVMENEWELFKKEIQTEEVKSEIIIEQEASTRYLDRDLEEVDELIYRWSKIEDLHVRKENLLKVKQQQQQKSQTNIKETVRDDDSDGEIDLESVLNLALRSKARY